MDDILDRQLLGVADTLTVTAILLSHILLSAAPPYVLSRKNRYHPTWRGIECFSCYALAALVLGAVFAAIADDGWSALNALSLSGGVFPRIFSMAVLLAAFVAASWLGSRSAAGRKGRVRGRKPREE